MKKFIVAAIIIVAFIAYSLMYSHATAVVPGNTASSSTTAGSQNTPTPTSVASTPSSTSTGTATPTATASTSSGQYKNGTYTGSVANAQWGYIQVQAVIQGGKITNVIFLQYPQDRNRSIQINSSADPQLTSEAIQAQSANVDIVTGATDSSEAFIQSLTDALSQAKA
jgi:uncharacterized protein with FMN-binding domain